MTPATVPAENLFGKVEAGIRRKPSENFTAARKRVDRSPWRQSEGEDGFALTGRAA